MKFVILFQLTFSDLKKQEFCFRRLKEDVLIENRSKMKIRALQSLTLVALISTASSRYQGMRLTFKDKSYCFKETKYTFQYKSYTLKDNRYTFKD